MRLAVTTLKTVLAVSLAAAGGCDRTDNGQNIAIADNMAGADIEALPPDESSETSLNELVNGSDNADVTDLNAANAD